MKEIINFFEFNRQTLTGGQPTPDQIKVLKDNGVDVLVNLSPSSTRNYLANEAELAEKNDLIYFHIPVDCSNLQEYHFKSFKAMMDSVAGEKVFVHCGGNIKSSNLVHMYNVVTEKEDEKTSFEKLSQVQNPEEKWDKYFKQFSMMGFLN